MKPRGRSPRADVSIRVASREARVSGRFALVTQCAATRRNDGACCSNQLHAPRFALNCFSIAASNAASRFSFE
jgi:hypothetical protein